MNKNICGELASTKNVWFFESIDMENVCCLYINMDTVHGESGGVTRNTHSEHGECT